MYISHNVRCPNDRGEERLAHYDDDARAEQVKYESTQDHNLDLGFDMAKEERTIEETYSNLG